MFFEYELKRHYKDVTSNFSTDEISKIIDHAIFDLKNRNIAGSVITPLAFLVGGLATEYASEQSFLFSFLGGILFISIVLRVLSIVALSKKVLTKKHIWIPVFFWSNIFISVVWGSFAGTAILLYHDSSSITLIVILLAGIGAGSMASYCIWKLLSYAYLIIILGIPMIAEYYVGNVITVTIGVALSFFLAFNLAQTNVWNKHYWLSLINSFVIEKNALELEILNNQLTAEITDHKRTAQQIVISREKLQDIFNSAHDGVYIFDLKGHVLDINETMLKMFRINRQKALKFNIARSFHSERNPHIDLKTIWLNVSRGDDQEFTWLIKGFDTEEITVQVNLRKSLWGEDSVVIATVRDISQQVTAMEATIAANLAKTEFLANMSHEIRTPMHGILGYARLGLKRSGELPREKVKEYFYLISESGKRLMSLLDNVLDFSKLEVGKMRYDIQKSNLARMIHEVTTELTPIAAEKELYFKIQCTDEVAIVHCDQEKIMQVLRNLLFNAIKFSYEKNKIEIICERSHEDAEKAGVLISIFNRGIPIPNDELSTIFEKFTQSTATNTGAGGTGLGLAISKRIVNGHGGSIWAENHSTEKTVLHFILPGKATAMNNNDFVKT